MNSIYFVITPPVIFGFLGLVRCIRRKDEYPTRRDHICTLSSYAGIVAFSLYLFTQVPS